MTAAAVASASSGRRREAVDELVVVTLLLLAHPPLTWLLTNAGAAGAAAATGSLLGVRDAATVPRESAGASSSSGGDGIWSSMLRGLGAKGGSGKQEGVEESGWVSHLDGVQGVRRALLALSGVWASQLLAVEVLWTPEQAGDTFSREDLLEDYPHLQPL
eukprot:XP_001692841.1 predicted protein [Chlamydomonas reinhardtii]